MAEKKVTGPASYFPSIEKKYGKPIEHWMKELKKVSKLAHLGSRTAFFSGLEQENLVSRET
jgi:hypothetical protein